MKNVDEQHEQARSEIGRLNTLALRFAPADFGGPMPADETNLFQLEWWREALGFAIREVLGEEHPLFATALAGKDNVEELLKLWRGVAGLPYEEVERLIVFVHQQRGQWELEDYLEGDSEEVL